MSGRAARIVVATADPIAERMAGPAIRAWHIAEELSRRHDVELVTLGACERSHGRFSVRAVGGEELVALERWMDVLVFQGGLLRIHPFLGDSEKPIVADVYDPFHLENLEPTSALSSLDARFDNLAHLTGVLNEQLRRGDFFLCASERQRDFWLGSLAALGRVTPASYDEDPTLRRLIDVVPFGVPDDPPRHTRPAVRGVIPGISADDHLLLWGGGVYNWFDPLTLLEAVDRVRRDMPTVRLLFMGMRHPNPHIPEMSVAAALRRRTAELGIEGSHVFFNDAWVPYDERANHLLEADIGVSTHSDHIETAFSFRTRILDYLWAGLPIITTRGDSFAELVDDEHLGVVVEPGDVGSVESALRHLLSDEARRERCATRAKAVAKRFRWSEALGPLLAFCDDPKRAPQPDLALDDRPSTAPEPTMLGAARATYRRLRGR